jgi:hypothetical protein
MIEQIKTNPIIKPSEEITSFKVGARIRNSDKGTIITVTDIENNIVHFTEETETDTYTSKIDPNSKINKINILEFKDFLIKTGYTI